MYFFKQRKAPMTEKELIVAFWDVLLTLGGSNELNG